MSQCSTHIIAPPSYVHGRSGRVALLRVKVVLARAARFVPDEAAVLRAVRRALFLRSVLDMVILRPIDSGR